jgi:hypothetical protein
MKSLPNWQVILNIKGQGVKGAKVGLGLFLFFVPLTLCIERTCLVPACPG